ncbi:MAG: endo-1,4-beta-xylanase [Sedimentisphaerales bacterium]
MKFQVFSNGKAVQDFELHGAYLFGSDGMAVRRAQIQFADGLLYCEKPNQETAGLALLWPVDGVGRVLLPTTCLPERDEPYNLNLELARGRLMQIINKREDWSIFEDADDTAAIYGQSQDLFIRAIQNIADGPAASQLADQALQKALDFSEELSAKHAKTLFGLRGKNHGFGRGCLGCWVDPKQVGNPAYLEQLAGVFGLAMVPFNWGQIELERGAYDFSKLDACISALSKKKLAIGAGPLLCFAKEYLPKWLLDEDASFEKIRECAYQFVSAAVSRYGGMVRTWCVVSGLNAFNHFGFGFEQVLEITRAANMAVKAVAERSLRIIEVVNPWGEYYGTTADTIPPVVYMDMVIQSGINFDAFGLQMRFGRNESGMHVRDMMQVSAVLDSFAPISRPMYITRVEIPGRDADGPCASPVAGVWHGGWDQKRQAEWLDQFYRIALSRTMIDGVIYSSFTDTKDSAIADSGLLTANLEPKESYVALKRFHDRIFGR